MRRTTFRRGAFLASALGTVAAQLLISMPAQALLPPGEVAVAAAGSDTTDKLMTDLATDYTGSTVTINGAPATVRTYNIPALPPTAGYLVDGDAECSNATWTKDPLAPTGNTAPTKGTAPFGSGAGRTYLTAQTADTVLNDGARPADKQCVDVARSSSYSTSAANLRFYGFALDAVSWATTALRAPSTLTRQQITDIYDCVITDWGSLPGGSAGAIKRYFPQPGSGTRSFFISDVLVGKTSSYVPPVVAGCSDPVFIEENKGAATPSGPGIADADIDKAILPYAAGPWMYQESNRVNPTLDIRKGARLGGINNTATPFLSPVTWIGTDRVYSPNSSVYSENNVSIVVAPAAPAYPGVRYVWNVLDSSTSANAGYQGALGLFGFVNTAGAAKSPTCDGTSAGTIASNFFAPLSSTGGGTHNVNNATCRLWP